MNKWNDIVIVLKECLSDKVLEKDYQPKIEDQFKLLGWSVYYGCIESKPRIETANTNIFPDIVLKKDGRRVMPIELKRPTNNLTKKNERQLFSYMRQLEIRVGLYIGEKVQLYYNAPDDSQQPHPIITANLLPNSEDGIMLCEMLSYENFNSAKLEEFCQKKVEVMRYQDSLRKILTDQFSEERGVTFIRQLIESYFSQNSTDINILKQEIAKIRITAEYGLSKKKQIKEHSSHKLNKYSLNGSRPMFKRTLALEAVRLFVEKHPKATYNEIEQLFNLPEMPGGYKVVRRLSDITEGLEYGSLSGRFFTAPAQILTSGDNIQFAVSNQWDYNNFPVFVNILKKLRWKVKEC